MANAYMDKIEAFVRANEENVIRDIKRLVDIPSVAGTPEPGAPNGAGPAAALKEALALAGEMGLATGEFEGHMGWAELPGSTDKQIATITHMDVVPAGNGWTGDPFNMRVQDGWLIGRGVADDKGPGVLCLYALKFLKENNVPLKYSVRALLGTSEETGMEDVDRYLAGNRAPDFCFSPDAEFPVCNGEKGHFRADLVSPVCGGQVLAFEGGVAFNAVPDRAAALVRAEGLLPAENITLEPGEEAGTVWVRGWGKSGHAAMPEGTVNPALLFIILLTVVPVVLYPAVFFIHGFTRMLDYDEDAYAVTHVGAKPLARALAKLHRDYRRSLTPNRFYSLANHRRPHVTQRIEAALLTEKRDRRHTANAAVDEKRARAALYNAVLAKRREERNERLALRVQLKSEKLREAANLRMRGFSLPAH